MTCDVLIIGGGVMGCSTASHLRRDGFAGRIIIIERDPTYRRASSALAMGGIRQQFGSAINIRLAQYSIEFYKAFDRELRTPDHAAQSGFEQRGYLFLVDGAHADRFERRYQAQRQLGAHVERLDMSQLRRLLPDVRLDDIEFGVFGPDDGYAAPRAVLAGFRHMATSAGVEFIKAEVAAVRGANGRVDGVTLDDGQTISSRLIVNAAGPYAGRVAVLAGVDLPVVPVRQHLFRCALPRTWPYRFPMVIDPTGVHWRHEDPADPSDRDRIIVAKTKLDEAPGENFTCDDSRWHDDFRPPLVRRVPAFERVEVVEGWAGLYEMTPDHNPIIGEHPDLSGFLLVNGFSGHGLMMAPAIGKMMSELIRLGRADTFDITPFALSRFRRGELFWDEAMI